MVWGWGVRTISKLIPFLVLLLIPVLVQNASGITGFGTDNLHFDTGSSPARFLALDRGSPDIIISIDPTTGIGSMITTLMDSTATPVSINGCALAKNPDDGKWYTVARAISSMHLFEVDVSSGLVTDIGDLNQNAIVASLHICALSFEGSPAKLVGHDSVNNKHILIDVTTGEATDLGPTTFTSGIAGLATSRAPTDTATSPTDATVFTHPTGTLFGVYQDKTDGKDYLIWVDVTTGKANKIVEVVGGIQFRGIAFGPNGKLFVIENPSQNLSTINMITGVKTIVGVSTLSAGSSNAIQDPNLGDVRHGKGHDNGFCMNLNCINVNGLFNHFPETTVPQGSTQTFTVLVNCPRGANTCNHISLAGALPDADFYDDRWRATVDRQTNSGNWIMTVYNPFEEIGDVTVSVQSVDHSFITASFNIQFLIPGSIGTPDGIGDPQKNNRHIHVTVWDNNKGASNYIFNEGIYVDDIYAYPQVETLYETPLELEPLCLNENPNKRYTCAFDMIKEWTIKNAENVLSDIK